LGAAIIGAIAAGKNAGGYDNFQEATAKMARIKKEIYRPNRDNGQIYMRLYEEYMKLHDYFGRHTNDVMKNLREISQIAMS